MGSVFHSLNIWLMVSSLSPYNLHFYWNYDLIVFHWSLSDRKSPQVFKTLLGILAGLNNTVVWMVSTRPPSTKSSSPFNNPLVNVPKTLITIGLIITFMFYNFFNSLVRSRYWSFFSFSISFIRWSAETAKSTILQFSLFVVHNHKFWCSGRD